MGQLAALVHPVDKKKPRVLGGSTVRTIPKPKRGHAADDRSGEHDPWKRHLERKDRDERRSRQGDREAVLQCALANAYDRFEYDGENRCFQPEEQRGDERRLSEGRIEGAQQQDRDEPGQNEESARDDSAGGPVQKPADVSGELLRFRAGQQHAVVQGMQEPRFADPAASLDELPMHQGDLPGGAAEAQPADLPPHPGGFGERHRARLGCGFHGRK